MKIKQGFTLIELLIALALVTLILRFTILSYINTTRSAREARRKADLEQLRGALEQYKSVNGLYPLTGAQGGATPGTYGMCTCTDPLNCPSGGPFDYSGATGYIPNLAPNYIQRLPKDPRENNAASSKCTNHTSGVPCYLYKSNGYQYKLIAYCGVETQTAATMVNDSYFDPIRDTNANLSFQISSNDYVRTNW